MGRKKNKTARAANGALKPSAVVVEWEKYMGQGELEDWQRLMGDLGFDEQFPSKTKCRQALKSVWVNIFDFLMAIKKGEPVHHFRTQSELAAYTKKNRKFYPKKSIPKGSPLRQLLAQIFANRGRKNYDDGIVSGMGGLSIAEMS
ncbi:hypothetical protein F4824DRAFT_133797 [Ustulina deusta]|nr:hypothetical protein F4824DRAFT_133797 [Ustulina deusta]